MSRQRVHQLNGESLDAPELPKLAAGWCWTTLETIAEINGGITKDQKRKATATTREVPYLRVANVQRGFLDLNEIKTILADADELDTLRLRTGDVLFTEGGDRDKLGRGWVWNDEIADCIHQNHIFRARLKTDDISPKFVSLHGNTFGQEWFSRTGKQTTNLASINKGVLRRFPIPVAPANEQRRIVAKIEELFSDLDAGVAALQRARANLKRYRASVLKSAVEGKLTADWRAQHSQTEPASVLLQRILKERRAKWEADQLAKFAAAGKTPRKDWQKRYVEPTPPDTTGLPDLPEGWCWASADQVCSQITDGEHNQPRYAESGFPMLTATHVRDGFVTFAGSKLIAEEHFLTARKRCCPEAGNILIVCVGATTGRAAIVGLDDNFALVRSVLLLKPLSESGFMLTWIRSPRCQQWISTASGASAQAHFYISDAKRMPVPIAPFAEQVQLASDVAERLSQIDAAESAIEHGLQRAARLRQSVLKQAFEGKLVPQDPADEPASALLERIQSKARGAAPSRAKAKAPSSRGSLR